VHSVQPAGRAVHFVYRQAEPVAQTPGASHGRSRRSAFQLPRLEVLAKGGVAVVIAFSPLWVLDRRGVRAIALMDSSCSIPEPVGFSSRQEPG
jgi:hypothetical protein